MLTVVAFDAGGAPPGVTIAPSGGNLAAGLFDVGLPAGFVGDVRWQYTASDGVALVTATASLCVTPVNDAPAAFDDEYHTELCSRRSSACSSSARRPHTHTHTHTHECHSLTARRCPAA
ncbi:MAG: hypothetical protein H6835_19750 [Planctomycetes bacterium]|nr:hypothetical protein [Planctomycetota bacterium]